jgi:4-hydroxy-tetrahydrodipicolinate synthase
MEIITGAMTALITPFTNGKVDEECYANLIQRQVNNGINAVVPVGTTGESATLSHEEHQRCIEIAVEVCKNSSTKVVAGAGSNSTIEAQGLATFAQKVGADAILSVAPYYNKPTQEGLYQHYKAIANAVDIPVMLYNVPGRTGVDILPSTVYRLFDDVENIYAIKEATGSMERTVELLANRENLTIVSGDDPINYPLMANGATGCISVTANIVPNLIARLTKKANQKDFETSKMINDQLFELNKVLFCESNPIPIKAAMHIAGLIPNLEYRLPLTAPAKESLEAIEKVLSKYEIVK